MLKDALVQEVDLFLLKPHMASRNQGIILHHLTLALADQKAGPNARVNLMKGVLHGDIQAWLGVTGEEGARRIVGMLFTTVTTDPWLDVRRLLIYGLYMREQLSQDATKHCLMLIESYAKKRGCCAMRVATGVHGISRLLEKNGWANGQSVLVKEI